MAVCGCPPTCHTGCVYVCAGVLRLKSRGNNPEPSVSGDNPTQQQVPLKSTRRRKTPLLSCLFCLGFPFLQSATSRNIRNYLELKQSKTLELFSSKGTFQSIEVSTRSARLLPVRTHRPLVGKKGIVCGQENQHETLSCHCPTEMLRETYL